MTSSSAVPNTPSSPRRTRLAAPVLNRVLSIGSLNTRLIERTKNTLAPSVRLTARSCGAKVSATTSSTCTVDCPTLPPVSVARICRLSVLPPTAMVGTATCRSNGKLRSLATTRPLTTASMLRTCTSSVTVGLSVSTVPSTTCTPGLTGSMSKPATSRLAVGACPFTSNATKLTTCRPPAPPATNARPLAKVMSLGAEGNATRVRKLPVSAGSRTPTKSSTFRLPGVPIVSN